MKFLKTLNKICEGLMWLYLPIIMFYWSLTLINLSAIAPLKALFGKLVQPLVILLDKSFNFQFTFGEAQVDYTPVILAIFVALMALVFIINSKILDFVDEKLKDLNKNLEIKKQKDIKSKEHESLLKELNKNKVIYVILKLIKIEKHESYLVKNENDSFSVGLIDSYEISIKNIAKNFSGKEYKDPVINSDPNLSGYIFTDVEQFIIYITYLTEKIKEINKGTADLNTVFSFSVASSCSYTTATANIDFQLANKVLNLAKAEEVLITDLLKQKLKHLNSNFSLKFESKGMYMIDNKSIDVHGLKIN
ncbi:MAG TPA: hypothetical protein P5556_04370 [Candidatus Gastranaerophilales bacterium]|nr:hypothetical protein [Candidatus Gastranaerophilales bacterium]